MLELNEKEVFFDIYCPRCQHESLAEDKDPCHDCLATPSNIESHKPIYFKENTNLAT